MLKTSTFIAVLGLAGLAGCIEGDANRALVGAGAGVVAAEITDTDPTTAALAGATAGALFDDVTGR